jgi:hypothetical protein
MLLTLLHFLLDVVPQRSDSRQVVQLCSDLCLDWGFSLLTGASATAASIRVAAAALYVQNTAKAGANITSMLQRAVTRCKSLVDAFL